MPGKVEAEVVICGAGIAGICTAYHLATKHGLTNLLIVDPESPLSVTSDKSYEGYRNWWPGPDDAMVALMNRSIDLLEVLHRSVEIALQSHSIYEHDRFTNTGSGQTREKADTKGGFASV